MFNLLGGVFIALGLTLLLSNKKSEQAILKKSENVNKNSHAKQKNKSKAKEEAKLKELKKSKGNAYSFIFAGISCILVEIITKFL